jgi:hypothetical protein
VSRSKLHFLSLNGRVDIDTRRNHRVTFFMSRVLFHSSPRLSPWAVNGDSYLHRYAGEEVDSATGPAPRRGSFTVKLGRFPAP